MIDLTVLASSAAAARDALVARNIIEQKADGFYAGRLPGVETTWDSIPNPFAAVDGTGDLLDTVVPAAVRNAKVYLVRLAHEASADDENGDDAEPDYPRFSRSKAAKWVRDNSTKLTIDYDGGSFGFFRVDADWGIVHPKDAALFGVWQ